MQEMNPSEYHFLSDLFCFPDTQAWQEPALLCRLFVATSISLMRYGSSDGQHLDDRTGHDQSMSYGSYLECFCIA